MQIHDIPIGKLIAYDKNAKIHSDKQNREIANSLLRFGWKQPLVVDRNNVLIVGHGRLEGAKIASLTDSRFLTAPCIIADDLTDEEIKAYRLADNKLNESPWDFDLLDEELQDITEIDMSDFGFDMSAFEEEPAEVVEDDYNEELPEEPKSKLGDIYQLGRHRLMCGDSTKAEDVSALMGGDKADMVFTDPAYNIGYQGVSDKRTVRNDKMDDERFVEFLKSSLMNCETMYVCCSWQYAHLFRRAIEENGNKIKAMIVWDKVNPAQHLDKYFKQHEIIWYCGKFGGEKTLRGDIWQVKRQANTVHPTMKPIELIAMALQDNLDKRSVYDGFGGSGSTLIACEQLDRSCYMMELDPKYVDVIIDRWEQFTGQKAVKLN